MLYILMYKKSFSPLGAHANHSTYLLLKLYCSIQGTACSLMGFEECSGAWFPPEEKHKENRMNAVL